MSELEYRQRRRYRARPGRLRRRMAAYRHIRSQRPKKRIPRVVVPSFFTLMNLFSGFLSIAQVYEGNLVAAAWLIVLAGFFDMLDGIMARLARAQSQFGVELDSLCDVVSFGVAPAFLIYAFGLQELGTPGVLIASLPAICGAVRLARFNINFNGEKKEYYSGLPIPAQAITIVAFILTFTEPDQLFHNEANSLSVLIPLVVILSFLMISTVRFDGIPKIGRKFIRDEPWKALAIVIALILVLAIRETGLFISLTGYILFSLGRSVYSVVRDVWDETSQSLADREP